MKKIISFIIVVLIATVKLSAQWTVSGSNIYNSNTGNVGIGINTNIQGKLHVGDNALAGIVIDSRLTTLTGKIPAQIVWAESGTYSAGDLLIAPRTDISSSVRFFSGATTPLERLTISGNGNIGIGINAPTYKLDVNGISRFAGSVNLSNNVWHISNEGAARLYYINTGKTIFGSPYGYEFRSSADAALAVLTNTGNLGIGTINPVTKLDIVGLGANNIDFQTTGRAKIYGSAPGVSFNDGSSERSFIGWIGSGVPAQAFGIYTPTADTKGGWNTFNVMNNGAISMGALAANANAKLDVTGNIYCNSKIFIGTPDGTTAGKIASYSLAVSGDALINRVKVKAYTAWADYVFEEKYNLLPLPVLEQFIKTNKHLPEVASAAYIEKEGIDLGANQTILLKKVEELTLYLINQNKMLVEQDKEINTLKKQLLLLQLK